MKKKTKVTVIGSVAFDSVETARGSRANVLGGSAVFAALSASFFAPVNLISVVGTDFPEKYFQMFKKRGVDTSGLTRKKGKTFRWKGKYDSDLTHRKTLSVDLNVFNGFRPEIPANVSSEDYLLLANIDPELQDWIFKRIKPAGLVACDTMDLWINTKRRALLKLLKKVDLLLLNDEEARQLSGEFNLLKAAQSIASRGVRTVVIKKGEHGALLFSKGLSFIVPPFLIHDVKDPTGAGDTFAGGMIGYLSGKRTITDRDLRSALVYGSILASYAVEKFSVDGLVDISRRDIDGRYKCLGRITRF
ncbi:MAG: sugar kinase [Candidatus Omnitrophica bacterium]|nr:sugar kinase [Candidatus Omnitrophota bacterium]MBU1128765.1 sugar kinase [Candidatus Omnitrophota bacterium]MBU1785234.1 sugar kinase [Candidatus Omnitrophota bacterium]MBU1851242.1 sugar kinase [Candidatus Omnitrophota bacterium]